MKSNNNGRAFEYCITQYILDHRNDVEIDRITRQQQTRDLEKFVSLSVDLQKKFTKAAQKYNELLPEKVVSIRRLTDTEGQKGNPADLEVKYIDSMGKYIIKNISLKNNHLAVKHQRPGALISQLGVYDPTKNKEMDYRERIKLIENSFFLEVENAKFDTAQEVIFKELKNYDENIILNLYRNICGLVTLTLNEHHANADSFFKFLVSTLDFEKVILQGNSLVVQRWYDLDIPESMHATLDGDSYINIKFTNGFIFRMRLHTASSKCRVGKAISLKFDTRLFGIEGFLIPEEKYEL